MHCNVVHAATQGPALNESQALKIANNITTLMKDCDATLAVALLDRLQARTRLAFLLQASQSPDTPRNLPCYQAPCAGAQLHQMPITMPRLSQFGASLRTDCAATPIAVTFDKTNLRALKTTDPLSDQALATNERIKPALRQHTLSKIAEQQCANGCEGEDTLATHWCTSCQTALCPFCVKAHSRIPAMQSHPLSKISSVASSMICNSVSVDPSPASSLFSAPSRQVERRVSFAAEPRIYTVPSRCLLPAFVVIAKALRHQTSYNKRYKSSFLDAMELEFGFCRRSGNTPENQLARLLQLEASCTYEDYYEHALCDASVLTIRAFKVPTHAAALDSVATCSASNNPAEILEILSSTVLLKPAVGPPQSMREIRMIVPTFDITDDPLHFDVPGQAVALPGLPSTLDSLISVGRLFEAGYKLDFRLPVDAITDNVDLDIFPRYGGTIVTPSSRIIHMIYENYTWTLPVEPHFVSSVAASLRPFKEIMRQPSSQDARHNDEVLQRCFELDKTRRHQATNLHNSFGHPHNAAHCFTYTK